MKNGPIKWFVNNHVASTLLMIFLVAAGIAIFPSINRNFFPETNLDIIQINAVYPGATPVEVENAVCIRIEEAVAGVSGIDSIDSVASEESCFVSLTLFSDAKISEVLSDVKNAVDGITSFPEDVERPMISRAELLQSAIDVVISGDADEHALRDIGVEVRDALVELPEVSQVELKAVRPFEISIEVSESSLQRFGLTFEDVAQAIRNSSLDLPGGIVQTSGGDIVLRTRGQAFSGKDFEDIVILTRLDGTRVHLTEVAKVIDGFDEKPNYTRFDGKPAVIVRVLRTNNEDTVAIADAVGNFIDEWGVRLPEGVTMTTWKDQSTILRAWTDVLLTSARIGIVLVLTILCLFLQPRPAFWVCLGIPIAMVSGIALFNPANLTFNVITLFALILAIGLLVDDAIVVAESIHMHEQKGHERKEAAIKGTRAVSMPVIFGVLTTIAALAPLLFVPTMTGRIMYSLGAVVILCLVFSLIESQLIMPAHMASSKIRYYLFAVVCFALVALGVPLGFAILAAAGGGLILWFLRGRINADVLNGLGRVQKAFSAGLTDFAKTKYQPFLKRALKWRYVTVAFVIGSLILTVGLMASGFMRLNYLDSVTGDFVVAELVFPPGTPEATTREGINQIEKALAAVRAGLDRRHGEGTGSEITHLMATVGSQPFKSDSRAESPSDVTPLAGGGHVGEVMIALLPTDQRRSSADEVAGLWRETVGPIPGAVELSFSSAMVSSGEMITIQLKSADLQELRQATDMLKAEMGRLPGVHDISDSHRGGKRELQLSLRESAESLGLTISNLAGQVRQAYYGEEVQKIQRGRDEVKVMVRYPRDQRHSLASLEDMRIRTPDGQEVPFKVVAEVTETTGAMSIQRSNRKRAIGITASADTSVTNASEVVDSLMDGPIPEILAQFPTVSFATTGQQKTQKQAFEALGKSYVIALLVVFSLLAIPLRSFTQPLIIMSVIPFALVGVVIGHLLMGVAMTFLSFAGFITLSGIVVNASLVLVVEINRARDAGASLEKAVVTAGLTRFRPIILTSSTTFFGLAPLIFNRAFEAQFLVPMAITVGFGVVFATLLSLVAVPCVYLIVDDIARSIGFADTRAARADSSHARPPEMKIIRETLAKEVVLDTARCLRNSARVR